MNWAEVEEVRPGQLFQLWSGNKRGIVGTKWVETTEAIKSAHVHDSSYLLLVTLPEDLVDHPAVKVLHKASDTLGIKRDPYYEFLVDNQVLLLNQVQLLFLEEAG